jgi:pimeloyl-ACP methyl ester carboxylesterase
VTEQISRRTERKNVSFEDVGAEIALHIWERPNANRTLVCVHGFVGAGRDFGPLAETLAGEGIQVIAPDLFGRGESTFFKDLRYYHLANQLLPLREARRMAAGPICYLGTSLGGILATAYLQRRRWRSAGLFLNDVSIAANDELRAFQDKLIEESKRTFDSREEAAEFVLQSRAMTYLKGDWREEFIDGRLMQTDDKWRLRIDPVLAEGLLRRSSFSIEGMLKKAPIPVLMAFGENSPFIHDPLNEKLAAANPNIALLKLADDPHPPALIKQDQVSAVADFLARCFSRADRPV